MSTTKRKSETGITRFSKRIRGLAPGSGYSHTQTSYLPLEVKRIVLEEFAKSDLKLVRLVSKDWCFAAVPLLFDRIYISPRERDLDVFIEIIDHPVLSQGPKSLNWDASMFLRRDRKEYVRRLSFEAKYIHPHKFDDPSTPYQNFINECVDMKGGIEARDRVLSKYHYAAFVKEGFKLWQEITYFERSFRHGGYYYTVLCDGLRKLDRLRSVTVTPNLWDVTEKDVHARISSSKAQGSGSPLLRSWDLSHGRPFSTRGPSRSAKDFHLITCALAETAVEIREFNFYEDPYAAGLTLSETRKPAEYSELSKCGHFAYRNLRSFNIKLCVSTEDEYDSAVKLFSYLLRQMPHLKTMCIDIDDTQSMKKFVPMQRHDHRQIFPPIGMWSCLTDFTLSGATFEGWDFLMFISMNMQKLRHLKIHDMELMSWSWDGVFESLNLVPRELRSISLPREARHLRHHNGQPYPRDPDGTWDDIDEDEKEIRRFFEAMEHYVIHGGRHPSLPLGAPSSRSAQYLEPYMTMEDDDEGQRKVARYKKAWKIPANSDISGEEQSLALRA